MSHSDRAVFPDRKSFVQLRDRVYLTPCDFVPIDIAPAHRCDVGKSLRECSIYETQDSAGGSTADRRFHHACRRRRADVDWTFGQENRTNSVLKALEQLLEFRAAMRDHRLHHGGHDFLANLGRPRKKERPKRFCCAHFSIRSLNWSKFSMT